MSEKQKPNLVKQPDVRCSYDKLVALKDLEPHPKNPNEHPPKQIELFMTILSWTGWRRPITVSNLSGKITKGHGAMLAAEAMGLKKVPVDYQDYSNEEEELSDLVADNTLQRMSEMNTEKLTELLVELNTGDFNMELTGLDNDKLEKLLEAFNAPGANDLAGGEGAPVTHGEGVSGSTEDDQPGNSQVRMVQLFFNEKTVEEFTNIVEFFMKEIEADNMTDCVMEILRSAFRAHTDADSASNKSEVSTPEGAMA